MNSQKFDSAVKAVTAPPLPLNQELISLLSLPAESTDKQITAAVAKLKTRAKAPLLEQTEREKKIRARMDRGKISYDAAALAEDSQSREDAARAKITRK